MKKFTIILALVLMVSLLAGCAGTTVIYTDCTCPAGGHTAAPQPAPQSAPEGAVKTGLAIVPVVKGTDAGEADGKVEFDVTLVAVTVDDNGVITDCVIDSLGTTVAFTNAGAINPETNKAPVTKNELGEAYGMKAYAGSKYEWNEQAAALADYAVGKTVDELKNGAVDETGHAADADLATVATIYIGSYVEAIEVAVNNAQHLGAQAGDELRLATTAKVSFTDAAADANGLIQLDCDAVALTMKDGVITSCALDSLQAKVNVDATGVVKDLNAAPLTKNQLGENYGMVAWGGAKYEWNEQAANFAAYVTGKTPAEVSGIAVNEATYPTDADLTTGVTIAIGGFQALIAKATA